MTGRGTTGVASGDSGLTTAVVVLAAGDGSRVGSPHNKVFLPLAGRRIISWSLNTFAEVSSVCRVVLLVREVDRRLAEETIDREVNGIDVEIIVGGKTRHESELLALRHLAPAIETGSPSMVLIHDGARPLVSAQLVRDVLASAAEHGAALPGLDDENIRRTHADGTLDCGRSERLVRAQTPQAFEARQLLLAYSRAESEGFVGTDTSSCWEQYTDADVMLVPGDPRNLKITFPGDLFLAENLLRLTNFHIE